MDLDDLDAQLFGKSLQPSSSPIKVPKSPKPKADKSTLLSELFGDSFTSLDTEEPLSFPQENKSLDGPSKAPVSYEGDNKNEEWVSSYLPTSESRQRRRQNAAIKPSVTEDLWSKFLQEENRTSIDKSLEIETSTLDEKPTEPSVVFRSSIFEPVKESLKSTSPLEDIIPTARAREVSPRGPLVRTASSKREPLKQAISSTPEEQFAVLEPFIVKLITEKINTLWKEMSPRSEFLELETKLNNFMSLNLASRDDHERLENNLEGLKNLVEGAEQKTEKESSEILARMEHLENNTKKDLETLDSELSKDLNTLQAKITLLDRELIETCEQQKANDAHVMHSIENMSQIFESKFSGPLAAFNSKLDQEIQNTESKISKLERLCSSLNTKLDEEREQWGEAQEARLNSIESKCRQMYLNKKPSGWEEDMEFRVERTENNFESRIMNTNKQQARLGAWQERQIADLAEYMDQRLWSLHNQLEIQRREIMSLGHRLTSQQCALLEPCTEADGLKEHVRKLTTSQAIKDKERDGKLIQLESRMINIEDANSNLSRLAERLCGLLQMWEQRYKNASVSESDVIQSLQERYNMALIEMRMDKRN